MRILILLSLSLFTINTFAYQVYFGESEKSDKRNRIDLLGTINDKVYIYKSKMMPLGVEKHEIFQYDPNTLVVAKEAKLEIKRKNLERIVIFSNKILIFQSEKESRTGTQTVWYDIYDAQSLMLKQGNIELVQIEYKKGLFSKLNSFTIIMSEDESKLAIYYDLPYEKGKPEKFGIVVYDENMTKLYANQTELPVQDELMTLGIPHISNDGKFYMSSREVTEKGLFGIPKNVKHHIYHVKETGELIDNQIVLQDKYIYEYTYHTNDKGELILTGLYGEAKRTGVNGGFYIRLNKDNAGVASADYTSFPDEFITAGWSDREKKKADKRKDKGKGGPSLYNYDIRAMVTLDNGGAVFVAEQYYVVVTSYTDANGNTRYTYHYYYNDVIILKLNGEGKFEWYAKLPKYQHSTNDNGYYSSFAFHASKEKLYFMYNDNMKNYEDGNAVGGKTYPTSFRSNKNNVTSLAEVNILDGKMSKKKLFSKGELGTIAVPKIHHSDRVANILYIFGKKKRNERLGKIVF